MILFISVLKLRQVVAPDGLTRADATMARNAQIIHLGTVGERGEIGLAFVVDDLPTDEEGKPLPFPPEDIVSLEFLILQRGAKFPPGYQFRAAVLSAQGMLYLFEKVDPEQQKRIRGTILLPTGRGIG